MSRTPEQFEEAVLDVLQVRWQVPTYQEEFNAKHLSREGAWVYALAHWDAADAAGSHAGGHGVVPP